MTVFCVMRFDPMQCGACGNGNLDKIFMDREKAEAYIASSKTRRGVGWQIKTHTIEDQ